MKSVYLKLVLVLFALLAFSHGPTVGLGVNSDYQISATPSIDIDPVRNPTTRGFEKLLNYIADPFFPIVILAHSLYEDVHFEHYLPVYILQRTKEFFLVI